MPGAEDTWEAFPRKGTFDRVRDKIEKWIEYARHFENKPVT